MEECKENFAEEVTWTALGTCAFQIGRRSTFQAERRAGLETITKRPNTLTECPCAVSLKLRVNVGERGTEGDTTRGHN